MLPGMSPKKMESMLKAMGIKTEELEVKKVVFEMKDKKLVFENPKVSRTDVKGISTYQIIGEAKELEEISEEDIKIVMEKANVSYEVAKKELEKTKDIAEAILNLKS